MQAASKYLTSVTLELGGKSPTIVDNSANAYAAGHALLGPSSQMQVKPVSRQTMYMFTGQNLKILRKGL